MLNKIGTYQAHMCLNILIMLLRLYFCFDGRLTYASPENAPSGPKRPVLMGQAYHTTSRARACFVWPFERKTQGIKTQNSSSKLKFSHFLKTLYFFRKYVFIYFKHTLCLGLVTINVIISIAHLCVMHALVLRKTAPKFQI